MLGRFIHDIALVAMWILCYWITSRIVSLKELDPRPSEAIKFMGPLGVVIAIFTRPLGLRGRRVPVSAQILFLYFAIALAFFLGFVSIELFLAD